MKKESTPVKAAQAKTKPTTETKPEVKKETKKTEVKKESTPVKAAQAPMKLSNESKPVVMKAKESQKIIAQIKHKDNMLMPGVKIDSDK